MIKYNFDELKKKAEAMQNFLERPLPEEPNELIKHLESIDTLMAMSGRMLADAKYYQDAIKNAAILTSLSDEYSTLSQSAKNEFIKTEAKDQNYMVNWIDRINACAVHIKDSIRTIISYRKKELEL